MILKKCQFSKLNQTLHNDVGATDGMRLIDASNNADSGRILNEIRSQLKRLFGTLNWLKVGNVDMLSGEKEGEPTVVVYNESLVCTRIYILFLFSFIFMDDCKLPVGQCVFWKQVN